MNKLLVAALGAVLLVGVGCQKDRSTDSDVNGETTTIRTESSGTMSGVDDCAMCEGVQTARADGTCPQCGMKLKTANR